MSRIQELEAELEKLRNDERAKNEAESKRRTAAFNALPYEYNVKPHCFVLGTTFSDISRFFPSYPRGDTVEGVRVMRRKQISEEFKGQDNPWCGMTYFRTEEGVLCHEGGGIYVLRDALLTTDAEWEAIKRGQIPEKFVW